MKVWIECESRSIFVKFRKVMGQIGNPPALYFVRDGFKYDRLNYVVVHIVITLMVPAQSVTQ